MQGSVVDTAKIAPDFRCVWDPVWDNCGKPPSLDDRPATARQMARAEALALAADRRVGAVPQAGDSILLVGCNGTNGTGPPGDPAATANSTSWTQRNGANWAAGEPFQIALAANPSLCITAGAGGSMTLQQCGNNNLQQSFVRNATAHGDGITGPSCCWSGEVLNPLDRPFLVCEPCPSNGSFQKNQRFSFPASGGAGQIHRFGPSWEGWTRGNCVAALPKPAGDAGWYMGEDYEDRHGSFLSHGGQWYFFTNDRSHSADIVSSAFRDTVGCCENRPIRVCWPETFL